MAKCCELTISELKHYVTVEQKTLTPDNVGGAEASWSERLSFWCAIKQLSAFEVQKYGALQNEVLYSFKARYADASTIVPTDRLVFRGENYNIRTIENVDLLDTVIKIVAERGVSQ